MNPRNAAANGLRVPGDWMLHPLALGAAFVLGLNDRVLKAEFPSWWTGKLSDVAGLLFFPWLLVSLFEIGCFCCGRRWPASRLALLLATCSTAAVFAAIKVSGSAGQLYEQIVGWLWAQMAEYGHAALLPGAVRNTVDPTDLLALPAVWVPWALGNRRVACDELSPARAAPDGSRRGSPLGPLT